MAVTPAIVTAVFQYEDAKGNLTGDVDQVSFYTCDSSTASLMKLGVADNSGAKSFIFLRGNARLTDLIYSATPATLVRAQLVVNNLPRNIYWAAAAQGATALRPQSNIRIAGGSQVEFLATA